MNLKEIRDGILGWLVLIGLTLLVVWVVGFAKSSNFWGWSRFSSLEGGFSMDFPNKPKQERVTGRMNDPRFQVATFFTAEKGGAGYMAGYTDEFDDTLRQFTVDQILDAARDGAIANVQGRFLYELKISKDGFPGREVHFLAGGGKARFRVFLVGKRKFTLGVVSRGPTNAKSVDRFLNSFEITRRQFGSP